MLEPHVLRVAFFSPMPPSGSGIADYAAALVEQLSALATVQVRDENHSAFQPDQFDIALYQVGNNGHHGFAYEQALRTPGVVVLHESNLHHLLAEITIKHGDWDRYLREVEYDGGPEALAYARRVRALEIGPDYEGVPMLRRLLERSRGIIVHSRYMECEVRKAGYNGPVAVIPHGAWIPEVDRMAYRDQLGVTPDMPLAGIFGYLKPYKRIAESLRAFRRLLRLHPDAKMILVGAPHPDFPLQTLIHSLGLSTSVRVLGFTPMEDFTGYMAACDIVLNLRYPTVGESSGTLLRALGLGRAVIVSDVGSFSEYPDEICLKAPVDVTEEETLFEYLSLLVSRPGIRRGLGDCAREWVAAECNWQSVARRYLAFLDCVVRGSAWNPHAGGDTSQESAGVRHEPQPHWVEPEYILGWADGESSRAYVRTHLARLEKTLAITPSGSADKRILEMGAYLQITPALQTRLGYGEVRGCYYGKAGETIRKEVQSESGQRFACDVDLFDAGKDPFPYADEYFDTVLCCELIEHLPLDPMHMMAEINRILKPGGHVVITTPNIASLRAVAAILQGYHPGFFPAYLKPAGSNEETDARHNREYAPREIALLLHDAGFEIALLETGEFRNELHPEHKWVLHMLNRYELSSELRGDGIYAVGVKRGPVLCRYPSWLYN
jgi:glycosyltransferase involved in cell wall biosynthesis/SAM-dependent methyltransferase